MVEKGHRKGPKTKDQRINFSIQLPTIPYYIVPDRTLPFSITIIITLFRARGVAYLLPKIYLFSLKESKEQTETHINKEHFNVETYLLQKRESSRGYLIANQF
jgi:hypothetical protein